MSIHIFQPVWLQFPMGVIHYVFGLKSQGIEGRLVKLTVNELERGCVVSRDALLFCYGSRVTKRSRQTEIPKLY